MGVEELQTLVKQKKWAGAEQEWLEVIEQPGADPARLLAVIDDIVEAGENDLAETMAWAWLSWMKESCPPAEALRLGRGLLLRLPDGDELRGEILALYRQTHGDRPDLEVWIDRSGLKSGKSVRRALGYLTKALRLAVGTYLVHTTEDVAAQVTAFDADAELATIETTRRSLEFDIGKLVEDYDIADENDFRVLSQLQPQRLVDIVQEDPIALAIGILRAHHNRIDRDELKLLLVPRYLPAPKWTDWWTRVRNGVKRSPNLRIEGRSPMFLIFDEEGRSAEEEAWIVFSAASTPRQWHDVLEAYLRDTKGRKEKPDAAFLDRAKSALMGHIERFIRHKEPATAFAAALVIERIATDAKAASGEAHALASTMVRQSDDPAALVAAVSDTRLWSLATECLEEALPDKWPELFAELILFAPAGQCERLAKKVEAAGRGDLLPAIVERAAADPGRFTDAMMWVWKGSAVKTPLPAPPLMEMLNLILGLVGPERISGGKAAGQTVGEMRAKVRTGLSSKDYARFRECIIDLDNAMAQTVRRQIERAEGLGPRAQDSMIAVLRARFPQIYVKAKVSMWEDESVLYFSRDGLGAKERQLRELVDVKMRENAKAIGEAAARGDLSENAEYKFALEERDLLRARVARINADLSLAKVIEPGDVPDDHVSLGQKVTLRPAAGGEPLVMTILGAGDSDPERKVFSYKTPMAGQILGKRPGDTVALGFDDDEAQYRIERIESVIG